MAEEKRKSKKKSKTYPFTNLSRITYELIKWLTIIGGIIALIRWILIPAISKTVHGMFDNDKFLQGYDDMNKSSNEYLENFIPRDTIPKSDHWSKHVDDAIMFDFEMYLKVWLIALIVLLCVYVLSILLRHHKHEMAPFKNDRESKRLKRRIIRNIGAERKTAIDEENKEIKNLERIARFRLRLMRVEIHTRYEKGSAKPLKTYQVRIGRIRNNDEVNQRMLKKIKNLHESLSSLTNVSFGAMSDSNEQRYYTFNASKEISNVKESIFVKWRKRKLSKGSGSDTGSEYAFPLTLFVDNSDKIESKRESAEEHAEQLQESVRIYLLSEKVQVNTSDVFTGNTSVQLTYALPSYMSSLPNLESLQTGLDASLNIQGTLVTLRGSSLSVVVPLPEDLVIPIDVKSMIEAEF